MKFDTDTPVDEASLRLHEAAEGILAARMRAQGRAIDGYREDEYLAYALAAEIMPVKPSFLRAFAEPSDGLEPSTPCLPSSGPPREREAAGLHFAGWRNARSSPSSSPTSSASLHAPSGPTRRT